MKRKEKKEEACKKISFKNKIMNQKYMYDIGIKSSLNNVATRHKQENCYELKIFDENTELDNLVIDRNNKYFKCYGCNSNGMEHHSVYLFSCKTCGDIFQENRHLTKDLTNYTSLVIGSRTKLGHQIVVKLLKAGSDVIGTSRYPEKALELFKKYPEWEKWQHQLHFYPVSFDLDTPNIKGISIKLREYIEKKFGKLDILINCAAQTIRIREKGNKNCNPYQEKNRYGDAKFVKQEYINSWNMTLDDLEQNEMEEVYRINAIAPTILTQELIKILERSQVNPYIINVHAREGLFSKRKGKKHFHTNMAKAGLHMLTHCLACSNMKTLKNMNMRIHGVDPGWISIDEYYENGKPWESPPLDEIDGAARVLFPVFKDLESFNFTCRHFIQKMN